VVSLLELKGRTSTAGMGAGAAGDCFSGFSSTGLEGTEAGNGTSLTYSRENYLC
jgi:hypothetical protein